MRLSKIVLLAKTFEGNYTLSVHEHMLFWLRAILNASLRILHCIMYLFKINEVAICLRRMIYFLIMNLMRV